MAAYCDFKDINGGKVVPYQSPRRNVNKQLFSYKYENHVYWETVIFTVV